MDAAFTVEQDEIRRTLRELLAKRCGPDDVRAAVATGPGHDAALWRELARDLGLPGLAVPEAYGGVGCTATELALACEETGRALLPSPLLATACLVAPLVLALGTEPQRTSLLPRIAAGTLTAALAVPGASLATALGLTGDNARGDWAGGGRAGGVQARRQGDAWTLYGEVDQVLDGHCADLLLVAAHAGGFPRSRTLLFLVRADATGLTRTRLTALDATRPQARVELRDVAARLLGAEDTPEAVPEEAPKAVRGAAPEATAPESAAPAPVLAALAAVGRTASAALAAEAVGAASHALDGTVAYVKEREQFGRPIGSFQAVKHRLADLYVRVQAARSAAYYAAWDPTEGPLALATAVEALRVTTGEAIQLHGGIGFTWEHEAHLYFKRAASDELLFGPAHRIRERAADLAGLFHEAAVRCPGAV
ncbi:acyl-CoA dehydrogenase family protein [Streptomyces sp. NPDC050504]|uniref:acyl-CoA dehydrogenase family protein n=1 Tax=Streptomyces sp. NPDC050504 TaxID=3365618 RepID=UPI0037A9E931